MKSNILFIVINSLSSDKCYDEKTSVIPNLDML